MAAPEEEFKSDRFLHEIKRREAVREVVDVEEAQVKIVVFTCGTERYAFYGRDIREILPPREIAWMPELPSYLPGLINVRGDIESVIDIRCFLGQEKTDLSQCLVAMAVRDDFRSGILVDTIDDVIDIPSSVVKPPLSTLAGAARDLVTGEIELAGNQVSLIGIERLATHITI